MDLDEGGGGWKNPSDKGLLKKSFLSGDKGTPPYPPLSGLLKKS